MLLSPTTRTGPTRSTAATRGFALPLVILLVLVGGLTVGLLMERHGVSARAIARNVDNYKNHHRAAGIKECVLRWLDTARGRVDQSLDVNGLAFSMEVLGEGRIDVYFRDAQGSVLSDPTALVGRRREIVEDMKFLLDDAMATLPPEAKPDNLYRPVGPPEMSIATIPDIALKALCYSVVGEPTKANRAYQALIARKESATSTDTNIQEALRDVSIEEKERREIAAMLIAKPKLYECVAETRDSSGTLLNKSSGLYLIDDARNDTFKQGGGFLTWDNLPVDEKDRR